MQTRAVLFTLALLCAATSAYAQAEAFHVEAGITFWKATPDIVLTSGSLGTPVDFINTFAVEKKRLHDYRLVIKHGKHKLRFSTMPIEYTSTATLNETIRFNGQTFTVGVPVTADMNWTMRRAGYEYDVIATPMAYIGGIADLKYNKMNATLTAPLVAAQTFERNVWVPTFGFGARAYLSKDVSLTGEYTGIKWDRNNLVAHWNDWDVYATANLGRNVGTQLGYRTLKADYDIDNDAGDLKLKGTYIGLLLRF